MQDSALLQAYREYEWELLRFLGRRLGSPSLASDIAHDLYLKLLGAGDPPQIRDHRAYLFSMAANLATDHQRVEKRRGEILAEVDGLIWRRNDDVTPERQLLARAELDHLEAAIATLPERCRRVFYLSRFEGRSQAEIADLLGVGVTTVYKDLKAAMALMLRERRRFRGQEEHPAEQQDGHGKS